MRKKLSLRRTSVGVFQTLGRFYDPDGIRLKPPEGVLGMMRLSGWTEFLQQFGQVIANLPEAHIGPIAASPATQGKQDQQWLLRRALIATTPNPQAVETLKDRIFGHAHLAAERHG